MELSPSFISTSLLDSGVFPTLLGVGVGPAGALGDMIYRDTVTLSQGAQSVTFWFSRLAYKTREALVGIEDRVDGISSGNSRRSGFVTSSVNKMIAKLYEFEHEAPI